MEVSASPGLVTAADAGIDPEFQRLSTKPGRTTQRTVPENRGTQRV
jgi:hypothetical protein